MTTKHVALQVVDRGTTQLGQFGRAHCISGGRRRTAIREVREIEYREVGRLHCRYMPENGVTDIIPIYTFSDTSRPIRAGEIDGDGYWYVIKDRMEDEIAAGKFLEWGEFEGHLYGTKLDEIRRIIEKGKMCILDLNPTVSYNYSILF